MVGISELRDYVERCVKWECDLMGASAGCGCRMPAVLDRAIGGVFAHAAVGHASEGDAVRDGVSVLAGKLGTQVGSSLVTIIDDPSMHGYGYEPFDAEGVACGPTELIKNGVMHAYMHSRETLAAVGEDTGDAGHASAEPGMPPLVRMRNHYLTEGDASDAEDISASQC